MTANVRLDHWFWRAFLRTALIPLLVIELGFLLVYWLSAQTIYQDNSRTIGEISQAFMPRAVQAEARALTERLDAVAGITRLFAAHTRHALATPYTPPASELARYRHTPEGSFVTVYDNGGAAAFYSGIVPLGPAQQTVLHRSVQLDPFMRDAKASHPLIAQLYLNSKDSYNRIYPYFDVQSQYAPKMDIPSFNFYYEADARHNPRRQAVWTDAYLDPAGQGWMVSSIAPVWQADTLAGVVGIDITLQKMVDELLKRELPWGAYLMLLGRDGTILALPPQGEHDWGLRELGEHSYTEAVRQNIFKPADFRIDLRPEGKRLAAAIRQQASGVTSLVLAHGQAEMVAWANVAGPNWTLLMVAEAPVILSEASKLHQRMTEVGWWMLAALLLFYMVFFAVLARRARQMSRQLTAPLSAFRQAVAAIGAGDFMAPITRQQFAELDDLGQHISQMGRQLADAARQEEQARQQTEQALAAQRSINQQQQHVIEVLSHQVRTPLARIDAIAQTLQRRGEQLDAEILAERIRLIREASDSLVATLDRSLLALLPVSDHTEPDSPVAIRPLLDDIAIETGAGERLQREILAEVTPPVRASLLREVLRELVRNAVLHDSGSIRLRTELTASGWQLRICGSGLALPPSALAQLATPFYRGERSRAVGNGLGLTMVARFMEAMGGRWQLDSADGEGLIVTLILPVEGSRHG